MQNSAGVSELSDYASATTSASDTSVSLPDLKPTRLSAISSDWETGSEQSVDLSVFNQGNVNSESYEVQLYLSADKEINGWDTPVGDPITFQPHNQDELQMKAATFTVPGLLGGIYYLGVAIDPNNRISELGGINNCRLSERIITVLSSGGSELADLKGRIDCDTKIWSATSVNTVEVTAINIGRQGASSHRSKVYLSKDAMITDNDIFIDTILFGTIPSSGELTMPLDVSLAENVLPGKYFIGALIDTNDEVEPMAE